ncbi:gliding motility-associated C-terminal domain-containing protein, partial [Subsaxibacter sp. CAU 1640]|uniref:T9SS type B sorting domain-containing protein n=1 Tax=Subsaxibacter sp. CAU 1640 TaxID=2933271 RepID=UPI00200305D7
GATGSATVTFTATDECGNTATSTATFTIEDTTPPVLDVEASDLTVECDGNGNTDDLNSWLAAQGGAMASDACSNVVWTNNFTELTIICGNTGSATVTFTATDECGNAISTVAMFTIEDTTAPVIVGNFEPVINVNCDDIPGIPEIGFEDACSTSMTVTGPDETIIGDVNQNYQIIREWVVDDACNSYTYTQTINVTVQTATLTFNADTICTEDLPIDLFDIIGDVDTTGTWSVTSGNAILNGSIFDPGSVSELGDYVFTYSVTANGQCPTDYEVSITVDDDCVVLPCGEEDVIISTTLTPNGDSYNEFFTVTGIEDCGFTIELQIFNRWGAKIYENFNYQNDWNGFASKASIGSSDKVPTGTYYYIINLKDSGLKPFAGPIYVATK